MGNKNTRATNKSHKKNTVTVLVRLHKKNDADLIRKLEKSKDKNKLIKDKLRGK